MNNKRTHQPHWKDSTRTARSQKRTKLDDTWANQISDGKYPTLRKLMTAIHNKEFHLNAESRLFEECRSRARLSGSITITDELMDIISKQMKGKQS